MLPPERVKPLLLHEDPYVRDLAAEYFAGCWSQDPDLVPMILEAHRRLGPTRYFKGLDSCSRFALTPQSLDEVLEFLAGATDDRTIRDLNRAIVLAPVELLTAREEALRANPRFDGDLWPRIERRREWAGWSAEALWTELQDFARRSADAHDTGGLDLTYSADLTEALGRRDVPDGDTIIHLLRSREVEESWLEIFLIDLAGQRRLRAAVPALVDKFRVDTDYMLEQAVEALARIGDPEASRLIRLAWPEAPEHFRYYTPSVLGQIKDPDSEEALLALVEVEADLTIRTSLCMGLCELFSERGVEAVRRVIATGYDTFYTSLEEELLPVVTALEIEIPEAESWRQERERQWRQFQRRLAEMQEWERRDQARPSRASDAPGRSAAEMPAPVETIRRAEPKVGRNEPCPCGSGKKFKKCCGRTP